MRDGASPAEIVAFAQEKNLDLSEVTDEISRIQDTGFGRNLTLPQVGGWRSGLGEAFNVLSDDLQRNYTAKSLENALIKKGAKPAEIKAVGLFNDIEPQEKVSIFDMANRFTDKDWRGPLGQEVGKSTGMSWDEMYENVDIANQVYDRAVKSAADDIKLDDFEDRFADQVGYAVGKDVDTSDPGYFRWFAEDDVDYELPEILAEADQYAFGTEIDNDPEVFLDVLADKTMEDEQMDLFGREGFSPELFEDEFGDTRIDLEDASDPFAQQLSAMREPFVHRAEPSQWRNERYAVRPDFDRMQESAAYDVDEYYMDPDFGVEDDLDAYLRERNLGLGEVIGDEALMEYEDVARQEVFDEKGGEWEGDFDPSPGNYRQYTAGIEEGMPYWETKTFIDDSDDFLNVDERTEMRQAQGSHNIGDESFYQFHTRGYDPDDETRVLSEVQSDLYQKKPEHATPFTTKNWYEPALMQEIQRAADDNIEFISVPSGEEIQAATHGNLSGQKMFYDAGGKYYSAVNKKLRENLGQDAPQVTPDESGSWTIPVEEIKAYAAQQGLPKDAMFKLFSGIPIMAGTVAAVAPNEASAMAIDMPVDNSVNTGVSSTGYTQPKQSLSATPFFDFVRDSVGTGEAAMTTASALAEGLIEQPMSGYKKLITGDPYAEVDIFDAYMPRTAAGQEKVGAMADWLDPALQSTERFAEAVGDAGYEAAGPAGGTLATMMFDTPIVGDALNLMGATGIYDFLMEESEEEVPAPYGAGQNAYSGFGGLSF